MTHPVAQVFVVDDDPAVRESLSAFVQSLGFATACYGSAEEFLVAYRQPKAGCAIVDLRMTGMTGLDLLSEMTTRGLKLPVIMVTGHGEVPVAVGAMKAGAFDFLEKPYSPRELEESVRKAIALSRETCDRDARQADFAQRAQRLTEDEQQVVRFIVAGKPNKVIAAELRHSLRTVHTRRASVFAKLGVTSRAELIQLVMRNGGPATPSEEPS